MLGCLLPVSFLRVPLPADDSSPGTTDLEGCLGFVWSGEVKKDGEEILRQAYRCPGTFRAHIQPKKMTSTQLFALETGVGHTEMLLPCAVHVTTAVRLVFR